MQSTNNLSFLTKRRFLPLFNTQFLGAFNDNLVKTSIFVLISYHNIGGSDSFPPAQLLNIGAILFILPYFLFSTLAGELCTKYDKALMAKILKFAEMCIMLIGSYGYFTHSIYILFATIFLMGTHSTFFGPLKYAIIPEYLHRRELLYGNSIIETGTFIAILVGQILGTHMVSWGTHATAFIIFLVAMLGFISSVFMPATVRVDPTIRLDYSLKRSITKLFKESLEQNNVLVPIIGISWFWFIGAVYTVQLPTWTQQHIGGNEHVFNFMLALFSVGIGIGSIFGAKISHGKLNLRIVKIGLLGMSIFGIAFALTTMDHYKGNILELKQFLHIRESYLVSFYILMMAIFGGFYSVPLYTWMQTAATQSFRAKAIGLNNIINSVFMIAAAIFSTIVLAVIDNTSFLFLLVALLNLALFLYIITSKKIRNIQIVETVDHVPTDNKVYFDKEDEEAHDLASFIKKDGVLDLPSEDELKKEIKEEEKNLDKAQEIQVDTAKAEKLDEANIEKEDEEVKKIFAQSKDDRKTSSVDLKSDTESQPQKDTSDNKTSKETSDKEALKEDKNNDKN